MVKYYYNDVLLPEIPADGFANCPYLMILQNVNGNVYVYGSTSKPYYQVKSSVKRLELPSGRTRTLYDVTNDVWGEVDTSTASTYCNLSEKWTVLWSNHDIPNGSATATEIYFYGTDPVSEGGSEPEEPEEPKIYTHTIDFTDPEWKTLRSDVFSVTDGTTPFFVDSTLPFNGKQTLRSGAIGHGDTSETTIDFILIADGSIELNYVVSSERKYDWLYIYIDDAEVVKQSGNVAWTVYTKSLSAGNHTVKFKYTKDGSQSAGSDTGAIGYVTLTGVTKDYNRKYLIQSGGSLFTVTDGVLTAVDSFELTAELFRTYGVDEIPASELLVTLTDPVVLYWVDTTDHEISSLVAVEQAVPFTQTLESEDYNMNHPSIVGIEKVFVDASDDVRFAVSFDKGQTWKTHTGQAWATLSEGDTGMSPSVLSAITTEDWNAEATTGKFRFRVTLSTVDDYVNSLVVDYLN